MDDQSQNDPHHLSLIETNFNFVFCASGVLYFPFKIGLMCEESILLFGRQNIGLASGQLVQPLCFS